MLFRSLMYDPNPDGGQRERVARAAAACPVQAISVEAASVEAASELERGDAR